MTRLDSTHVPALVALAERCAVDGGSPEVSTAAFVHRRFFADGVYAFGVIEQDQLVAAGSVNVREGFAELYGLVDPDHRGRGLGTKLLEHAAERGKLRVRTEALTPAAERLFAAFGLHCTFAEDVMRHDLGTIPAIPYPAGTTTAPWSDDTKEKFFATYRAAFQARPGFPNWTCEQWTGWMIDEDFRPDLSLLATKDDEPVAFITCTSDWIIQVGVDPAFRGQRFGAALIADVLARMDGKECWLDVNANNPGAAVLYHSLGFVTIGRRATYE
jgi:mycothiol synthase